MKHRTFFWFILPTLTAMVLFIALPIVSVFIQSLHVEHEQVLIVSESCGPFGCEETTEVDLEATAKLREERPLGRFNGLGTYINRSHLAFAEVGEAWRTSDGMGAFLAEVLDLPFYRALTFTIAYTAVVTPLVLVLGLAVAVGVNTLPKLFRGPTIFVSLLPMIVTPLVGSMILFWMVDGDGIIGATLQRVFDDPSLSLKASPTLTWVMLMVLWRLAPLAVQFHRLLCRASDGASGYAGGGDDRRGVEMAEHASRGGAASDAACDLRDADPSDGQLPGVRTHRRPSTRQAHAHVAQFGHHFQRPRR